MDVIGKLSLWILSVWSNFALWDSDRRSRRWFLWALAVFLPVMGLVFGDGGSRVAAARNPVAPPISLNPTALKFDHLSMQQGLSESTVIGIAQDQLGFMWFATQNGLNKFDGQQFTVYTYDPDNDNSLSMNNVRTLYIDSHGDLWLGTQSGGLDHFLRETETFRHFVHDPQDPNSLSDNYVRAIVEDKTGHLWIGTQNGLNRLNPATGMITQYLHDPDDPNSLSNNTIYGLSLDAAGDLWIGTQLGGCRFTVSTEQFTCYRHDPADPESISDDVVFSVLADSAGTIWFGTSTGLNAFDPLTARAIQYQPNPDTPGSNIIFRLYEDRQQRLWIGTRGGGLNYFDRAQNRFTEYRADPDNPNAISGDIVSSIFEDRAGNLWVGTVTNGLNVAAQSRHKFSALLSVATPLSIEGDSRGHLWIGSLENGLLAYTPDGVTTYRPNGEDPNSLRGEYVFALEMDDANHLWIGTERGLNRLDTITGRMEAPLADAIAAVGLDQEVVRSIIADPRGWLWIGTQGQLYCLNLVTEQFDCYRADPDSLVEANLRDIRAMHLDENGVLWLGTLGGLFSLNLDATSSEGRARQYINIPNDTTSLSENFVSVIQAGANGTLWIGTWGGGLNQFDPASGIFTRYGERQGLPNALILSLLTDAQNRVWIGTANGLAAFHPDSATFRTYDQLDGLPDSNFVQNAMFKDEQGKLYLGASNGVVAFNPDEIRDNPYRPPIVLTGFQVFSQPVPVGGESPLQQHPNYVREITLRYDQSVFSFEYVGLNFSAAAKNQYAYRMEGVDPNWNYVGGRRVATYTNLSPGDYRFHVIGANNDGVWNEEGLSIHLIITPPWWQTWWAYGLYVASAAAAVTGIVIFRTRAQTRQLAEQRREIARERQLREIVEQSDVSKDMERARIAREIHDGVAQTLAGVYFRMSTWKVLKQHDPAAIDAEIEAVTRTLSESQQELRRVIFALRPVMLEHQGLGDAVTALAENLSEYYEVPIHAQVQLNGQAIPLDVEHTVLRMIQELLHNAGRHAQAKAITLQLSAAATQLALEVRDDGIGFDVSAQSMAGMGHWGLIHLHERAALLKATLKIESARGQGTKVSILVPLGDG